MNRGKAFWSEGIGAAAEPILRNAERHAQRVRAEQNNDFERDAKPIESGIDLVGIARREHDRQAARRQVLPAGMVHDTGWNILLDLFLSDWDGHRIRVCDSAERWSLRPETAVRKIAGLIAADLIRREASEDLDGTACLGLTAHGREALERVLELMK